MTAQRRTEQLIAALRRAGVPQAAFFVNPDNLQHPWGAGRVLHQPPPAPAAPAPAQ